LSTVLHRVRLPDKSLMLWADGICIDQDNLSEKGHQVALMAKIYRAAQHVIIYIGPDDDGQGPDVCSLLEQVDEVIEETCKNIDMSWDSFPYPDDSDPLLDDPRWGALHSLLGQNWFDRGWVVQEAASAPSGQLLWGGSEINWDTLIRVHIWLSTRAPSTFHSFLFSEVLINAHKNIYLDTHEDFGRAFYDEVAWGTPSILRTLNNAKELDLGNPQDRIYAFMELPQHIDQKIWVKPNYYSTHLETYRQFATQYIQSTGDLELLDYVSHDETSPFSIPSWIPRWDISTWSLGQSSIASTVVHSRDGSTPGPLLSEDGSLRVRGVVIDSLYYISDVFEWEMTTAATIKTLWDRINHSPVPCPYQAPSAVDNLRLDAFLASLSSGTYDGEFSEWQRAQEDFATHISQTVAAAKDSQLEDAVSGAELEPNIYFERVRNRTHNKRFVLAKRGYMGLAPALVRREDLVGIIFGCKTPCVLRKEGGDIPNHEQYYTFLGATALVGRERSKVQSGADEFCNVLGEEDSKDWVEWDVEEQDVILC
jgi:hypothetical protein